MDIIDLDNLALEIAKKHLLKNVSFKEMGKTYYASPSTIHRRLIKWLAEDRFELHDKLASKSNAYILERDDELGETLVRKTGIWRARIVRIAGVEPAYTRDHLEKKESESAQAAYRASDELHQCLGEVAAELILNNLRKNMTIGISSGRGVGSTIEKLGELVCKTPSWAAGYENIRLVSLCGGVHIGKWELTNPSGRDYDADENVFALSAILKIPRGNLAYMTGPISTGSRDKPPDAGLKFNLDMAVIGLGQLNTQHHYFRDINELQLKGMSGPIRKIIEWQMKNPGLYDGLAEIVLRLYSPGAVQMLQDLPRQLPPEFLETLREVNETIHSVSPETIKNAGEIVLIAGGRQKLDALYGVLTGGYPDAPIDRKNLTLVTDAWTAEAIIRKIAAKSAGKG